MFFRLLSMSILYGVCFIIYIANLMRCKYGMREGKKLLFRIEDTENEQGYHRQYTLPCDALPKLRMSELETYIANEVRKEINNTKDRRLLSYSKSLGVCLLKYNKFIDNELHISNIPLNYIEYWDCKQEIINFEKYDICFGLSHKYNHLNKKIILLNFSLDVSNNAQVENYLRSNTEKGRKKFASPEKDKEVLLMQSPKDRIISEYIDSIYLLYALVRRHGMSKKLFFELYKKILTLDEYRFEYCGETERDGILSVLRYLYYYQDYEQDISNRVFQDSEKEDRVSTYFDSIIQLHDIQNNNFEDSRTWSDYNSNIISDWIWELYAEFIK